MNLTEAGLENLGFKRSPIFGEDGWYGCNGQIYVNEFGEITIINGKLKINSRLTLLDLMKLLKDD